MLNNKRSTALDQFFSQEGPLDLPRLKTLIIGAAASLPLFNTLTDIKGRWRKFWGRYPDERPVLFPKLEHLELRVPRIGYEVPELRNPAHFVWTTMKTNLGPNQLPLLKDVTLKCTWDEMLYAPRRGVWGYKRYRDDQHDAVVKDLEEQVRLFLPTWDGDTRGISFHCFFNLVKDSFGGT